jgi:hypothetical protein
MLFFHDFVKLSVQLFKSVTVSPGIAKMEGPYVLYKQVLLIVKILPCFDSFFFSSSTQTLSRGETFDIQWCMYFSDFTFTG